MDKKLKRRLQAYYRAPAPSRKHSFLQQHTVQRISMLRMMQTQLHYISKTIWLVSGLFAAAAFVCSRLSSEQYTGTVCAFVPFLVMISITESMRSYCYGMYELEQSARFSLKSILMVRLLILGAGNFFVLLLLALPGTHPVLPQLLYLLAPYFATASAGFMIVRRFPDRDGSYLCFAVSVLVAAAECVVSVRFQAVFEPRNLNLWLLACLLLLLLLCRECSRTLRMAANAV